MSQVKFAIVEAIVVTTISDGNEIEIDIKPNIIEFQTFEHISKPYVDATLSFVDDFGLLNQLAFRGTERFRITFGQTDDIHAPLYTKFFFVNKITDVLKSNDRSEILSVDLVEDILYIDSIKQLSRSFTAPIEEIIEEICSTELSKTVIRDDFAGSAQGPRKIVVPYMSPLQTIEWLKTRATTRTGSPIYLRASIFSNNLFLCDFDTLVKRNVVNEKLPLRYTSAEAMVDDVDERSRAYFNVLTYKEINSGDMMLDYENGNVGSYYANLDVASGITSGSHISVRDIITEFYSTNIIASNVAQQIFDPTLKIGDKLSDEYDSLSIFQVTSSNTYNQFMSYHDETVLVDQDNNITESKLKIKNKIIRSILKKNVIDIGIEGRMVFESRISPGNKIRVIFLNSDTASINNDTASQIDRRKSGDYFILAVNHIFKDAGHFTQMRLTKINEAPKVI
jgi:hypothetical protein